MYASMYHCFASLHGRTEHVYERMILMRARMLPGLTGLEGGEIEDGRNAGPLDSFHTLPCGVEIHCGGETNAAAKDRTRKTRVGKRKRGEPRVNSEACRDSSKL